MQSKEFENMWRPQLHVCGAIAHGHTEFYFLMDADMKKDANMQATVVSRVLDLVSADLGVKGCVLPQSLVPTLHF